MPIRLSSISGKRYGRLIVLSEAERKGSHRMWSATCDCGSEVVVRQSSLVSGRTKSCGCLSREKSTTHGHSDHMLFPVWSKMISRCHNKKDSSYSRYGSAGIFVCKRWRGSFEEFLSDMGDRPFSGAQIDRIDSNGPYSKNNCRWVDGYIQAQNRGMFSSNRSGLTGVSFFSSSEQWCSKITKNGRMKRKTFYDFFEACCWRKSMENKFTNFGSI